MENVLFLVCFLGTPVLMLGALLLLAGKAIRRKRALAGVSGWEAGSQDTVREVMTPILSGRRLRVGPTRQADGITVGELRWRSAHSSRQHRRGGTRTVIIAPLPGLELSATLQGRTGGMLESAALSALSGMIRQDLGANWAWALVDAEDAPVDWFTDARAQALEQALAPTERVHLRPGVLVLSVDGPLTAELLGSARERALALRAAVE